MIEITAIPNGFDWELVDNGEVVRSLSGAGERQNRLGAHYRFSFSFPPMFGSENGRILKSQLTAALREGASIKIPLPMPQGLPGTPVVDGAGQTGHSLAVRGLMPHYSGRVGWWLNVTDSDGVTCCHDIQEPFTADENGDAVIAIEPELRIPLADGDAVELANPVVKGFIDEARGNVALAHLYGFQIVIEEEI
jgi:hypothetical protein